jgi:hypothetical protein
MTAPGHFCADGWGEIFADNGLAGFEDFWKTEVPLFEEPNSGRGGWSAVARCELRRADGCPAVVFLKRQSGHNTRTLWHPWRGVPTFQREFDNIRRFQSLGIPTPQPLWFASEDGRGNRAILVTAELTGCKSLDLVAVEVAAEKKPALRNALVAEVAALLRAIHRAGLRHNCFYPKHVFLRRAGAGAGFEAHVLDLEKARRNWTGPSGFRRDLRTLLRRVPQWNRPALLRFLLVYLGESRVTPRVRSLWRWLRRNLK